MYMWVDSRPIDVSGRALPIMKTGSDKIKRTQLECLENFYAALGAFTVTVNGDRCCVYRSRELCTFLNTTMNGALATPTAMLNEITAEYVELVAILEQITRCMHRMTTMVCVLTTQSDYGKKLLYQIRPGSHSTCAFSFVDYIADSYQKALGRFRLYDHRISCNIRDIKSIIEYMARPTHDPSNTAIIFDAIVGMMEACVHQRSSIVQLMSTCRYQVSPEVIASQFQICSDHMCSSLELHAAVYHKELARCSECMQVSACTSACPTGCTAHVGESQVCCTRCIFGLRNMCRSVKSALV